jgi:hypothetical protein
MDLLPECMATVLIALTSKRSGGILRPSTDAEILEATDVPRLLGDCQMMATNPASELTNYSAASLTPRVPRRLGMLESGGVGGSRQHESW